MKLKACFSAQRPSRCQGVLTAPGAFCPVAIRVPGFLTAPGAFCPAAVWVPRGGVLTAPGAFCPVAVRVPGGGGGPHRTGAFQALLVT